MTQLTGGLPHGGVASDASWLCCLLGPLGGTKLMDQPRLGLSSSAKANLLASSVMYILRLWVLRLVGSDRVSIRLVNFTLISSNFVSLRMA